MNQISISVFTLSNLERLYADQAASWCLEQAEGAVTVNYTHSTEINHDGVKRLQYRLLKFIEANRADENDTRAYSALFDRLTAWDRAQVASKQTKPARLTYANLEGWR